MVWSCLLCEHEDQEHRRLLTFVDRNHLRTPSALLWKRQLGSKTFRYNETQPGVRLWRQGQKMSPLTLAHPTPRHPTPPIPFHPSRTRPQFYPQFSPRAIVYGWKSPCFACVAGKRSRVKLKCSGLHHVWQTVARCNRPLISLLLFLYCLLFLKCKTIPPLPSHGVDY